jgi:hypothetical protein
MPRDLQRTKPEAADDVESSGLDEFKTRERVTKEVPESNVKSGWSSDNRPRTASKVPQFKVPDDGEEILIKFVDDLPFAPIFQHWLLQEQGQRRPYTCIQEIDPETKKITVSCPLCDRGDKVKSSDWLNVIVLGDEPELQVWYATADPAGAVKERAQGKRTSPINKDGLYFAVSKKKAANGFNTYSIDPVKEEELTPDWSVNPLTETQLDAFTKIRYTGDLVIKKTSAELSELARKYLTD